MPLSIKQLKFIQHHSSLVEQTGTDYGEIILVYFRPRWKQMRVSTRVNLPRDESDTTENIEETEQNDKI